MTSYARIQGSNVVEIADELPASFFDETLTWVEIPDNLTGVVSNQYVYTKEGGFQPPSADSLTDQLLQKLAQRRWEESQKKVVYGGDEYSADAASLTFLKQGLDQVDAENARRFAEQSGGPEPTFNFKSASGFRDLNYADLSGIIATITEHTTNLFAIERRIAAAIKSANATSAKLQAFSEVDTVTWNVFDGSYDLKKLFNASHMPPPPGQVDSAIGQTVEYRIEE